MSRFIKSLFLIASLFLTKVVHAQSLETIGVWQFEVGASYVSKSSLNTNFDNLVSPILGVGLGIPLNNSLDLILNARYIGNRFTQNYTDTVFASGSSTPNILARSRRISYDNIEFPIHARAYLNSQKNLALNFGLVPSFLFNRRTEIADKIGFNVTNRVLDINKSGRFDLGAYFGFLFRFSKNVDFQFGYYQSFITLENNELIAYNFSQGHQGIFEPLGRRPGAQASVIFRINPDLGKNPIIKEKTKAEYIQLKDMVLLVRLPSKAREIAFYSSKGNQKEADKIKAENDKEILEIIHAFDSSYTFGKVLFFYDTASRLVRNGSLAGIFINKETLLPDPNIRPESNNLLVGEFGSAFSEDFNHSTSYGFVMYDTQFNQLKSPFPYFINSRFGIISKKEAIKNLDERLYAYLQLSNGQ